MYEWLTDINYTTYLHLNSKFSLKECKEHSVGHVNNAMTSGLLGVEARSIFMNFEKHLKNLII